MPPPPVVLADLGQSRKKASPHRHPWVQAGRFILPSNCMRRSMPRTIWSRGGFCLLGLGCLPSQQRDHRLSPAGGLLGSTHVMRQRWNAGEGIPTVIPPTNTSQRTVFTMHRRRFVWHQVLSGKLSLGFQLITLNNVSQSSKGREPHGRI